MYISFCYYQIMRKVMSVIKKKFGGKVKHTFFGKKILNRDDGGALIEEILGSENPCMIARIGSVEMQAINDVYNVKFGLKKEVSDAKVKFLYTNAGFFPCDKELVFRFEEEYRKARANLDVLAVLNNRDEDYWMRFAPKKLKYITLTALEPYYSPKPWSKVLKGKTVLVINPFASTIEHQFQKREFLFQDKSVLPEFKLKTYVPVQSIGDNTGGFADWFEALEHMKKEISEIEFDIAILGCGAYAFPLASFCKELGKKSIVLGGATQILFGVKGKRWDNIPSVSKFFNEYWEYPSVVEKPKGFEKVEGGCYW